MLTFVQNLGRGGYWDAVGRMFLDYLNKSPLPKDVAAREIEVFRRLLPELQKLERYEGALSPPQVRAARLRGQPLRRGRRFQG